MGRMIRLGWIPRSWNPKNLYPKNAFISMYGKVYQSTQEGTSGDKWVDNKRDVYIRDGGVTWKVVASSQIMATDEEGKASIGMLGSTILPYYVWGKIEEIRSPRVAEMELHKDFCVTDDSETGHWNCCAWGEDEGYPHHVTFYNNRLVGAKDDSQSVYLSEYNNSTSFSPDNEYSEPDYLKALSLAVTDDVMQEIRWFRPMERGLLVGTDSSLWLISLDYEKGFNIVMRRLSGSGVYHSAPLNIGTSLLFVQGAGRRIKAISGDIEQGHGCDSICGSSI